MVLARRWQVVEADDTPTSKMIEAEDDEPAEDPWKEFSAGWVTLRPAPGSRRALPPPD
jgi:hypothetical protein